MERGAKGTLADFEIVKKVGEGAFSSVYQVVRRSDGLIYALKKVKIGQLKQREKENALNEIRILASIDHPHIVAYKEAFIDDKEDVLCIVMEFLAGGDLYHKISECKKQRALIPERLVWRYLIQMVRGLKHLHAMKIVHRDLKSANLFLSEDLKQIKLGDLNVSKVAKGRLVYTQTGTPYYASPEVWRDEPYDAKSDIWSLGCVVYEMCNRAPPFNGRKMEELFAKVQKGSFERLAAIYSDDLQSLVSSLLRVSPVLRPSCDEILDNHAVKLRMREMEDDLSNPTDHALLLNTIRLTPNLKDLNRLLPEAKYETDKKRASSARPDRKETRESVSTVVEKVEQTNTRASASRNSYTRCQAVSPRDAVSGPQIPQGVPVPAGIPQPITGYMSPRQQTIESRDSRRSGRMMETPVDSRQSSDLQAEMLADRLQRMKEMIRSYERHARSPSTGQRQVNISRDRLLVQQPSNESRAADRSLGGKMSANASIDITRRKDSVDVQTYQHNARAAYYRSPQSAKLDEDQVTRRLSHERSSQLRHNAIPQSPTVRDSCGSLRSRLLSNNSPTAQRKSENMPPHPVARRESGSRSKLKTANHYEDEISRRVEDDIVRKHAKRLLQLQEHPSNNQQQETHLTRGIALKKHPKVVAPFIGIEKETAKPLKHEARRLAKPEVVEGQRHPSNSRRNAQAINEEIRRVRRSYEQRSRSRDAENYQSSNHIKETPPIGRVLTRVSAGLPLPKGSSEVRLKSGGGSNRGQLDLVSVHAGLDSLVTRKPSHSNRQLKDHQIEELDRINRRLDMMNKQILMEKGGSAGPGLLGMRRKQVPEEAFAKGHPH